MLESKRNLPHIYPKGAIFFITFRLRNSIPLEVLKKMRYEKEITILAIRQNKKLSEIEKREAVYIEEKRFFRKYDKALEMYAANEDFLENPEIAQIVAKKIHEYDGKYYDLIAYCIMPNHVHLLFDTANYENTNISQTMKLIKGGSAYLCNRKLQRKGNFWQEESYDHYVRNAKELENIIRYIVQNPVKAGLVEDWEKWEFTYWKD